MFGTRGTGRCTAITSIDGASLYHPSVSISVCVARTALGEPSTGSRIFSMAVPWVYATAKLSQIKDLRSRRYHNSAVACDLRGHPLDGACCHVQAHSRTDR